jgi:hypothetical protein
MDPEAPRCGYLDCGDDAVASRAVKGTVWFASNSMLSPANGDEPRWQLGGYIKPMFVIVSIHVCAQHNAVTQEVPS